MRNQFHTRAYDPATQIKLEIFRGYIREWLPVAISEVAKKMDDVHINLYDFFAGPGKDAKGNPGSPLIILNEVAHAVNEMAAVGVARHIRVVLNDVKPAHMRRLRNHVGDAYRDCCQLEYSERTFANAFAHYQAEMNRPNHFNLVILDQFGVKEVTPSVVRDLLQLRGRTDVIFFMSTSFIRRFRETAEFRRIYGELPDGVKSGDYAAVHKEICKYYRSKLSGVPGAMLAPFSIKKGANIFGVIFAATHELAMEKFLKVCWRMDEGTGQANYNIDADLGWKGQGTLFAEDKIATKLMLFQRELLEYIADKERDNRAVWCFGLEQGLPSHKTSEMLRILQNERLINVQQAEGSGETRKGSFYLRDKTRKVVFHRTQQ